MAKILHVDSSSRGNRSKSRRLAKEFIAAWQNRYPDAEITYRDLRQTIDQVVRIGRTFTVENGQFKGLANGRKILFITSQGVEYEAGSPYEGWDCQEPTLRYAFQFMGMTDIQFIHANGLDMGDEAQKRRLDEAQSKIRELVSHW